MYELVQVGERTFYIDCPAKIGIYRVDDGGVVLIDSGNDKEAGRRVRKVLDENGWTPRAIVNTHSNADHIGGNNYLQQKTGCKIYANRSEAAFAREPMLESSFLYGGYPPKELQNKFFVAAASDVLDISDKSFPGILQTVDLPGHYFHMIGVRTPDDVVFLADCLVGQSTLEKYHISFIYDVNAYLRTLESVQEMQAACFVPAHADAVQDIRPLAKANRDKVLEVAELMLELCEQPLSFEEILQRVFSHYGLRMDFSQYVLAGCTVRSYLTYLKDFTGALACEFSDSRLLWRRLV